MENEEGRKEYLVFPPSKSQCPASSQKGRKIPLKGNGRRIDYALYSDEGLPQDWKLVRCCGELQENLIKNGFVITKKKIGCYIRFTKYFSIFVSTRYSIKFAFR